MPFMQGTATDYLDLLEQFIDFVTDNSAQQPPGTAGGGMGSEVWTIEDDTTSGGTTEGTIYLHAPGTGGLDDIYINIQAYKDVSSQQYLWRLQGAVGFDSGLFATQPENPELQPGAINVFEGGVLANPRYLLESGSMDFTLVANGRRAVLITNPLGAISMMYVGFLKPYGAPDDYPFPLFIGGTHSEDEDVGSATSPSISNKYSWPLHDQRSSENDGSPAYLRGPGGSWFRLRSVNGTVGGNLESEEDMLFTHPASFQGDDLNIGVTENSEYVKHPVIAVINQGAGDDNPQAQAVGEMDGVFWVPGFGLSTNDILQFASRDHLVFENITRKGERDFACVKLE